MRQLLYLSALCCLVPGVLFAQASGQSELTGQTLRSHFTQVKTVYRVMNALSSDTAVEYFAFRRKPRFIGRYVKRGPGQPNYTYLYTPNMIYRQDDKATETHHLRTGQQRLAVLGQFFPGAFVYLGISGPIDVRRTDDAYWALTTNVTALRLIKEPDRFRVTGFRRRGLLYEVTEYVENRSLPERFQHLLKKHMSVNDHPTTPFGR